MLYRAYRINGNKPYPVLLSEAEKTEFETHLITRGKFRFDEIPEKPKIEPPFEARNVGENPKKPKEHKTRKA